MYPQMQVQIQIQIQKYRKYKYKSARMISRQIQMFAGQIISKLQ